MSEKKSVFSPFHDDENDKNGHNFLFEENEDVEDFSLTDELDHLILMHRDAHFAGDFKVMLRYYQEEGVGTHQDIELDRILYLARAEEELGQDLAPILLTGSEAEKVAKVRRAYEKLKEIYSDEEEKTSIPRLLADLILSEEEEPEVEIEAVVAQGTRIVPELIHLVQSDEAFDSLFPGYGYAPYLAIICLGKIGDASAIRPLFETLGREMVFEEEVILEALMKIGESAKNFLLKVLKGRPLTKDNFHAAFALSAFADDPAVAEAAFHELQDSVVQEKPLLRNYLIYCCSSLTGPSRTRFLKMSEEKTLPKEMRAEMKKIMSDWH